MSGYDIIEDSGDHLVIELTEDPSEDLAEKISNIDPSRVPIVISNQSLDDMKDFSLQQFVVITDNFMVWHHSDSLLGHSRTTAIKDETSSTSFQGNCGNVCRDHVWIDNVFVALF
jgi:hypothetical protein